MARLTEISQIAQLFPPADLAAAATNSDWIGLTKGDHVALILTKAAGAVGEIPTVTLRQATDNTGAGAKALNFTRVDVKNNADLTTVGQFTKVSQAAANTYAVAAGNTQVIEVIEFDAHDLDIANGFGWVQAQINDVGTTAQLAAGIAIVTGMRYGGQFPPSVLA